MLGLDRECCFDSKLVGGVGLSKVECLYQSRDRENGFLPGERSTDASSDTISERLGNVSSGTKDFVVLGYKPSMNQAAVA